MCRCGGASSKAQHSSEAGARKQVHRAGQLALERDDGSQEIFNAYFIEDVAFAQGIWKLEPLAIDHSWTPKRRRTEIGTPTSPDPNSQSLFTPRTFPRTPIRHNDPPNSS